MASSRVFLLTAFILVPGSGATGLATIRLALVAIGSLVSIGIVLHQIKALKAAAFFSPLIRPALATVVMAITILSLHSVFSYLVPLIRLVCEISAGGIAYAGSIGAMWVLAGRTEGAEAYLLKNIIRKRQ